jgi:hypothetical protein
MKNVFFRILFMRLLLLHFNTGFSQSHKLDSVKVEFEGFDT